MNNSAKALIVALVLTATGFAEMTPQQGVWSVSTAKGNHRGDQVVMLQTATRSESTNAMERTRQAKLDVICTNGKVSAIALEPAAVLRKDAISFTGTLPTTRVALTVNDQTNQSESWAVTDGGRTLTPYSESAQSKLNARWMQQILHAEQMSFALETVESAGQPTFETGQLSESLSKVGCRF